MIWNEESNPAQGPLPHEDGFGVRKNDNYIQMELAGFKHLLNLGAASNPPVILETPRNDDRDNYANRQQPRDGENSFL